MTTTLASHVVEYLNAMIENDNCTGISGFKKGVRHLLSTFSDIEAVLEDADRELPRPWIRKYIEVVHSVEDIVDDLRKADSKSQGDEDEDAILNCTKVRSCLLFPSLYLKQVRLRHNAGRRIMELKERLNELSIKSRDLGLRAGNMMEARETCSLIVESEIFGRDVDKERIINDLVRGTGQEENPLSISPRVKIVGRTIQEEKPVSVISIVGMGGLGKTTVAQLVYNDLRVLAHFQMRIWVHVSDPFDICKILTHAIESMGGSSSQDMDKDILQNNLHAVVRNRRFLLVLDDVWDDDGHLLEYLRPPLSGAAQGSKILVTTRSLRVAKVMETTQIHILCPLSYSDSWSLFTRRAFSGWEEKEFLELNVIAEKIVARCKGVPLDLNVAGSLLRCTRRTERDWAFFLESKWSESYDETSFQSLLLSYNRLPPELKQCFSFCSVFPKDHEIKKDELVQLWMAHGIFTFTNARKDYIEEIGEECFDYLLEHSLFQDVKTDNDGNIVSAKMHDLVHDLAVSVAFGDTSSMEVGNSELLSRISCRHLILLVKDDVSSFPSALWRARGLHTLLLLGESMIEEIPYSLFNNLRFLRALDLSGTSIELLSGLIKELTNLRYLSLCRSKITELPDSVTDLYNLQTLKLNGCQRLCSLPSGMSKMVKLRHLEIESTPDLTFLPNRIGSLSSLRTLCKFPVGDTNRGCEIGELENLKLLRGNLEIQNLERVMNENEATEVKLHEKTFLSNLSLHCKDKETLGEGEMKRMERVFQCLRPPHPNLRDLKILNYAGSNFPTWLEDSAFSKVVKVELRGCKNCKRLPGLGNLHSLEFLKIYAAEEVKVVGGEFYGDGNDRVYFPKLKQLCFDSLLSWEEWKLTEGLGDVMPSLRKLKIVRCHKLKALPDRLPNTLKEVVIEQCDEIIWMASNPLPLLEDLRLSGNGRGIFSYSLPLKILDGIESSDESLPSDGWGLLKSLHTLNISYCPRLVSLPDGLGQLKALQTLTILGCYQLLSLPEGLGQLEALQTIKIRHCYGLTSLLNGLGQFKALRNICIIRCTKLKSLSDGLVQLEALQTVCVRDCTELQSLFGGFEKLKSLRSLDICDCPKLKPLSNLQHLTALEELKIACCPVVTEQLGKEIEEDWRNFSHITHIVIDFQRIQ